MQKYERVEDYLYDDFKKRKEIEADNVKRNQSFSYSTMHSIFDNPSNFKYIVERFNKNIDEAFNQLKGKENKLELEKLPQFLCLIRLIKSNNCGKEERILIQKLWEILCAETDVGISKRNINSIVRAILKFPQKEENVKNISKISYTYSQSVEKSPFPYDSNFNTIPESNQSGQNKIGTFILVFYQNLKDILMRLEISA